MLLLATVIILCTLMSINDKFLQRNAIVKTIMPYYNNNAIITHTKYVVFNSGEKRTFYGACKIEMLRVK